MDAIDVSAFKLQSMILGSWQSFYSRVLYTGIISQIVVIVLVIWPDVHFEQLNLFAVKRYFPSLEMRRIKYKVEFTIKIPVFFLCSYNKSIITISAVAISSLNMIRFSFHASI